MLKVSNRVSWSSDKESLYSLPMRVIWFVIEIQRYCPYLLEFNPSTDALANLVGVGADSSWIFFLSRFISFCRCLSFNLLKCYLGLYYIILLWCLWKWRYWANVRLKLRKLFSRQGPLLRNCYLSLISCSCFCLFSIEAENSFCLSYFEALLSLSCRSKPLLSITFFTFSSLNSFRRASAIASFSSMFWRAGRFRV